MNQFMLFAKSGRFSPTDMHEEIDVSHSSISLTSLILSLSVLSPRALAARSELTGPSTDRPLSHQNRHCRDHHRSLVVIGFAPRVARLQLERPRMDSGSAASSSSSGAIVLPAKASSVGAGGGTDSPAAVASSNSTVSNSSSSGVIEASLSVTTRGAQEQQRQQGPRRVSSPTLFMGQQQQPLPYPQEAQVITFPEPYPHDDSDPLSFFLSSGRGNSDPLGFGLGSVADGTFGGRKATPEELLLFRSHRLLQAEAVGLAIGPLHSSGGTNAAYVRKRLGLVSTAVERQLRLKVLEQTNTAVEGVRALGDGASPAQQQSVINAERRNCHRVLSGVLDEGTATLRELSTTGGGGLGGVSADMSMGMAFPPSVLGSPATESQQVRQTFVFPRLVVLGCLLQAFVRRTESLQPAQAPLTPQISLLLLPHRG